MSDQEPERETVLETTTEVLIDYEVFKDVGSDDILVLRIPRRFDTEVLRAVVDHFSRRGDAPLVIGLGPDFEIEMLDEERMRFYGWERIRQ